MNELQKRNQNHELQLPQETKELLKPYLNGEPPNTLKAHRRDVDNFNNGPMSHMEYQKYGRFP